jgi:uncharacterized membrane protein YphA (DoxX/SURF4 family)
MLMANLFTVAAALGLAAFTVAATCMLLCFWRMPIGPERTGALNNLISNIGVVGGLLIAAGTAV